MSRATWRIFLSLLFIEHLHAAERYWCMRRQRRIERVDALSSRLVVARQERARAREDAGPPGSRRWALAQRPLRPGAGRRCFGSGRLAAMVFAGFEPVFLETPHQGRQFRHGVWLDQVRAGPQAVGPIDVSGFIGGTEDDDQYIIQAGLLPNPCQHIETIQ